MALDQVSPERLKGYVVRFSRERSPFTDGLKEVALELEEEFKRLRFTVIHEKVSWEGQNNFWNLLAQTELEICSPLLLLGAHYDAVEGTPGADDNASGLAVLLEVARILRDHPFADRLRFVAFTLEEWGMVGSTAHALRLKEKGFPLMGMISLEMVGFTSASQSYPPGLAPFYPKEGNFIGIGANWRSRKFLKRFSQGMRRVEGLCVQTITLPGNGGLIPAIRLSDHSPFWDLGFPALLVTDTSFYRNPHYHTASDTPDTLDFPFLTKVAQGVVEGIGEILGNLNR